MWKATVDRLIGFARRARAGARARPTARRRARRGRATTTMRSRSSRCSCRRAGTLLADASLELKPGEDVLVTGPSGSGKSTLFRALAGIWPYWKGRIRAAEGRAAAVPAAEALPADRLAEARGELPGRRRRSTPTRRCRSAGRRRPARTSQQNLERSENWAQVLSGGEQQRLAFARALLNKPDWLFLDEATASLPEDDQERFTGC